MELKMAEWKIGETKELLKTFIWTVMETVKTNPAGKQGKFVSLKCPDWCSALIYNKDTKKFIMVKEFRHGVNKEVYEFPSGTVEEGETPAEACVREVKEETGYKDVKIITQLYRKCPNPAFMNNHMNGFLVEVSGERDKQHLDENEFINVVEVDNPNDYLGSDDDSVMGAFLWQSYEQLTALKEQIKIADYYSKAKKAAFAKAKFEAKYKK